MNIDNKDKCHWKSDENPDKASIAMMLFATAFVMIQTPATGLLQAGLVRRKNAISLCLQAIAGVAVGSVLWILFGCSMTFGSGSNNGFIASPFRHFLMRLVSLLITLFFTSNNH